MRIELEDLPPKGRTVRFAADDASACAAVGRGLDGPVTALDVALFLLRKGDGLTVQVTGHATAGRVCDRCGQPLELTLTADETLDYAPAPAEAPHGEIELDAEDLDAGFFDGVGIDTDDVLCEAFALLAPMRVTCESGTCVAPVSLTSSPDDAASASPFAALKKLV